MQRTEGKELQVKRAANAGRSLVCLFVKNVTPGWGGGGLSMGVVVRDVIQVLGRLIMESRFGVYSKNRKKPQEFTAFFKKITLFSVRHMEGTRMEAGRSGSCQESCRGTPKWPLVGASRDHSGDGKKCSNFEV